MRGTLAGVRPVTAARPPNAGQRLAHVRPQVPRNRAITTKTVAHLGFTTRSDQYNQEMKKAMGWDDRNPYEYHYDAGLYYHEIVPNVICGSQPRNPDDVAHLHETEHVTFILNVRGIVVLGKPPSHNHIPNKHR